MRLLISTRSSSTIGRPMQHQLFTTCKSVSFSNLIWIAGLDVLQCRPLMQICWLCMLLPQVAFPLLLRILLASILFTCYVKIKNLPCVTKLLEARASVNAACGHWIVLTACMFMHCDKRVAAGQPLCTAAVASSGVSFQRCSCVTDVQSEPCLLC